MKDFKLDSVPVMKSGFTAPDAYFDGFADRLMMQLPAQKVKVVPLYRRAPVWVTSAAAAFILSLSLMLSDKEAPTQVVAMPDKAVIEEYLVHQSGMSSYEISGNLDRKDLSELDESINISDEAVKEYLTDQKFYLYE